MHDAFTKELLSHVPSLKAFAISLTGNVTRAEDLVQETLLRAVINKSSYTDLQKMGAWLFTILRNHHRSEYRKRKREVEDVDGEYALTLQSRPEQNDRLELRDIFVEFDDLSSDFQEALHLIGVLGHSYEDAAKMMGCAEGTIKSRVNRGRTKLYDELSRQRR